jgi:BirA family biotin operon repressor/biotin-[acetyl-CoA-carboxylase] ligase
MEAEEARAALAGATRFGDVRFFDEIDSTNRYLLDQARLGAPDWVVAVADHQTAGRGRLGRAWTAPPGSSLLLSVLLRPGHIGLATEELHLLTAATGLAAVAACGAVSGVQPALKWPNDLLVGDRKLAGILAEGEGGALVVGIGLNVNWPADFPAELGQIAVALNQLVQRELDRTALLVSLLGELDRWLVVLAGGPAGRHELAEAYRAASATIGRRVKVSLSDGSTLTGQAEAINERGHLVVVADDGTAVDVVAGDVVHVRGAGG